MSLFSAWANTINISCFLFIFSPALYTGTRLPPHAEPHEMNKAPQPITGSPSNPHPAPSPGLSQVSEPAFSLSGPQWSFLLTPTTFCLLQPSFPPGQPTSVVFATPPPPQMNPPPQPRQVSPPTAHLLHSAQESVHLHFLWCLDC